MAWRAIQDNVDESRSLASLSDWGERLYWRLVAKADAWGRSPADPRKVFARCIPLLDKTVADVEQGLDELEEAGRIVRYEAEGDVFLMLTEWSKNQPRDVLGRDKGRFRSKFPDPPGCDDPLGPGPDADGVRVEETADTSAAVVPGDARVEDTGMPQSRGTMPPEIESEIESESDTHQPLSAEPADAAPSWLRVVEPDVTGSASPTGDPVPALDGGLGDSDDDRPWAYLEGPDPQHPVPVDPLLLPEPAPPPALDAYTVKRVYDAWRAERSKTHGRYDKISPARSRVIRARLREFPEHELVRAIQGVRHDPWAERANHDDLVVLFRSREQVERFLEFHDRAVRGPGKETDDGRFADYVTA